MANKTSRQIKKAPQARAQVSTSTDEAGGGNPEIPACHYSTIQNDMKTMAFFTAFLAFCFAMKIAGGELEVLNFALGVACGVVASYWMAHFTLRGNAK